MSQPRLQTIGDSLHARGLISQADLTQATRLQAEAGGLLGQALLRIGAVSEEDLLRAQSEQLGLEVMSASGVSIDPVDYTRAIAVLGLTPRWLNSRRCALWQTAEGAPVNMIAQDILATELREQVERRCEEAGLTLQDYVASNQTIEKALFHIRDTELADKDSLSDDDTARLREMAEEAPVIDFVNRVFLSLIHI